MGTIEEEMIGVFVIGTTTTRRIRDYLLGTNRNSKKKQSIEARLKQY
jgi:hypothetical protein